MVRCWHSYANTTFKPGVKTVALGERVESVLASKRLTRALLWGLDTAIGSMAYYKIFATTYAANYADFLRVGVSPDGVGEAVVDTYGPVA